MTFDSAAAAEAWRRSAATRAGALAEVTSLLFELAAIQPGWRVLDVGTGTGETAMQAAGIVGPTGHVLAVDSSAAMIEAARVGASHLPQLELRVADAMDLPFDGPFDAAVARCLLMLVDDPRQSLLEVRRVLRPGGAFSASVWSSSTRLSLPVDALRQLGAEPPPGATLSRVLSLGDPALLTALFEGAGFHGVELRRAPAATGFPSVAAATAELRQHPGAKEVTAGLSDPDRERAFSWIEARYTELAAPDGTLTLPGEQLVARGFAPD
jgi:SAM-dependent methyltransferase